MEEIFLVRKRHGWEGDEDIHAYLERPDAEAHRDRLNEEPYDPDDVQDYYVGTLPLGGGVVDEKNADFA